MNNFKCNYCGGVIPLFRYMEIRNIDKNKSHIRYCCEQCKYRANVIRMGIKNKKYMPKHLSTIDVRYIKKYRMGLKNDTNKKIHSN